MACSDYTTCQDCLDGQCYWYNFLCHAQEDPCQGDGNQAWCWNDGCDFLDLWVEDEDGNVLDEADAGDTVIIRCHLKNDAINCENFGLVAWIDEQDECHGLVCFRDVLSGFGSEWKVPIIWDIPIHAPGGQHSIIVEERYKQAVRSTPFYINARECWQHTTQSVCESAGCYWWNNSCHDNPPTCPQLNNQGDCEDWGCYWYNDGCHTNPPACDEINNRTDCELYGCYWYGGSCHEGPPCSSYTTQSECIAAGCYWCDGVCQSTPCGYECIDYTTQLECETNNCYWYNGSCHDNPPTCSQLNNQTDCEDYGCYWHNGQCYSSPPCGYWTTQSECENAGCYWCNGACQSQPCGTVCSDYTTQSECEANGCYWCDGVCQSDQCVTGECEEYLTQIECENAGCYWYSYPNPFGEPSCHEKEMLNAYIPIITIGAGVGLLLVATLLIKPAPYYPPYYPHPQPGR